MSAWFNRLHPQSWTSFARREIGPIAAVLGVSLFVQLFMHIAEEMGEGDTGKFDARILYALRMPGDPRRPIGPDWLRLAAIDLTSLGSITVLGLIVVGVCGLFLTLKRPRAAAILFVSSGGGLWLSNSLKDSFGRERPPAILHAVVANNPSFPSGHAMLSATVFLTLGALISHFVQRRDVRVYILSLSVILPLLIGTSRVYLGVHWPTDVLAGWCIGAAWALAWWMAALGWERLSPHGSPIHDQGDARIEPAQ